MDADSKIGPVWTDERGRSIDPAEEVRRALWSDMGWPEEPPSRRWALLRRKRLHGWDGAEYLDRLILVQTPWFGLNLHRIVAPDWARDLHDHPWWFASLVLRGYYIEEIPGNAWGRLVQRLNLKRATDAHRIRLVGSRGAWTLVLHGPVRRCWGFHTEEGWIPWHVYLGVPSQP